MTDLETRLRQVAFSEPPLGFDPDTVATKAAKRQRGRRVMIAAAGVTLVLAGAAVATLTSPTQVPEATQQPPTYLPPVIVVKLPPRDQTWLEQLNTAHLQKELPLLLPGARKIVVDGFIGMGGELHPDDMSATVAFTDHVGKGHSFNVGIMGPGTVAKNMAPLAQACQHATGRCDKLPQPDGSTVVIEERGAVHYRVDATAVDLSDLRSVPPKYARDLDLPEPSPTAMGDGTPSLDDQQIIKLVTEWGLRTH